jgi:hypothetical protein
MKDDLIKEFHDASNFLKIEIHIEIKELGEAE